MKLWKFVLLGITGHLAETKVLPALAEFAYTYRKEVDIQLIGWSRSKADMDKIQSLLEWKEQHPITNISFIQDQYTGEHNIASLVDSLKQEQLVIYSAIPPVVFADLTKEFCPYPDAPIDILMEKPFGENSEQAQQILNTIKNCGLEQEIHFLDHYAFKSSLRLNKSELKNFSILGEKSIESIQVRASETAGVGTRLGYYNKIGALKDMMNHLLVELDYVLNLHGIEVGDVWPIQWTQLKRDQYMKYAKELGQESDTETEFVLNGVLTHDELNIPLTLQSGKKQREKLGQTRVNYSDGTYLILQLAPEPSLTYYGETDEISLNTQRGPDHDHVRVFHDILTRDLSSFRTPTQVLRDWKAYDAAVTLKKPLNEQAS